MLNYKRFAALLLAALLAACSSGQTPALQATQAAPSSTETQRPSTAAPVIPTTTLSSTPQPSDTQAPTATHTPSPQPTNTASATVTLTTTPTPTKTRVPPTKTRAPAANTATAAPTAEVTAAEPPPMTLISLTRNVKRGADATLVIQTAPGAKCGASYESPGSGNERKFLSLGEHTADANGRCEFTWNIAADTILGTGTVSAGATGQYNAWDIHIEHE